MAEINYTRMKKFATVKKKYQQLLRSTSELGHVRSYQKRSDSEMTPVRKTPSRWTPYKLTPLQTQKQNFSQHKIQQRDHNFMFFSPQASRLDSMQREIKSTREASLKKQQDNNIIQITKKAIPKLYFPESTRQKKKRRTDSIISSTKNINLPVISSSDLSV